MIACIEICEASFVVEYDYTVHSKGYPASRDEPASAMEYEVKVVSLYADEPKGEFKPMPLPIPNWLGALIQKNLEESDSVYDEIAEDEAYAGADDEYERRRDD